MNFLNYFFRKLYHYVFHANLNASLPIYFRDAQVWRDKGVRIGENTRFYGNVLLGRDGKDPITIGKNCVLTGCTILGHDASTNFLLGIERSPVMPVIIGDNCFIGHQAIVLMGVTIGEGSIIGAGAVVTKSVPPGSVVAGNPARVISTVQDLVERRKLLALEHPEYFFEPLFTSSKSEIKSEN